MQCLILTVRLVVEPHIKPHFFGLNHTLNRNLSLIGLNNTFSNLFLSAQLVHFSSREQEEHVVHFSLFCSISYILFTLLYFVHSPTFWSISYILATLLYVGHPLVHTGSLSYIQVTTLSHIDSSSFCY